MHIDDFAPNLSFFFSNGMDPEYAVIGRVARRIWAKAMKPRVRRQRPLAEAQVSHPDLGPQPARAGDRVQRHPHHAAGALRALRQLQLAPHQRLRRGDHHADRGERAPRAGDPAHHQQGVRPRKEREPAAGLVHHRGADRPGRGSGAARVPPRSPSAAACSARWSGCTSAAEIQEESLLLRDAQARRHAADHRRQHVPRSGRVADGHAAPR